MVIPQGRLFAPVARLLAAAGAPVSAADEKRRELVVERDGWRLLFARPRDVGLFVEAGLGDFGVAGKDTLREHPRDVVEVLDLAVGRCRLVLAVPADREPLGPAAVRRVATKYPSLTAEFLAAAGLDAQVIVMHGAVEAAPRLGLADGVVDLVQTGATLQANGLVAVSPILDSTARLIANPVAFRLRSDAARAWTERLRQAAADSAAAYAAAGETLNSGEPRGG